MEGIGCVLPYHELDSRKCTILQYFEVGFFLYGLDGTNFICTWYTVKLVLAIRVLGVHASSRAI